MDFLRQQIAATYAVFAGLDEDALRVATQQTYIDAYRTQSPGTYGYGDFYYGPSVDGDVIRDLSSNEWKQGHFTKVPLLVDRDGYEGFAFSNQSVLTTEDTTADLQQLFPYAKQHFFDRLYQLYPAEAYNSTFWQRQALFGDFIINCPTYYMAAASSDAGVPTYKLIFNAGTQVHALPKPSPSSPMTLPVSGTDPSPIQANHFPSISSTECILTAQLQQNQTTPPSPRT